MQRRKKNKPWVKYLLLKGKKNWLNRLTGNNKKLILCDSHFHLKTLSIYFRFWNQIGFFIYFFFFICQQFYSHIAFLFMHLLLLTPHFFLLFFSRIICFGIGFCFYIYFFVVVVISIFHIVFTQLKSLNFIS